MTTSSLRIAAFVALTGAAVACDRSPARAAFPTEADRVARTYIRTLHDSGAIAVLGRTRRESAAVPAFAYGLDAMGRMLPMGPIDTVVLQKFEPLPDSVAGGGTRLTYLVRGQPQGSIVTITVVPEASRLVVDEISVARQPGS